MTATGQIFPVVLFIVCVVYYTLVITLNLWYYPPFDHSYESYFPVVLFFTILHMVILNLRAGVFFFSSEKRDFRPKKERLIAG